MYRLLTSLALAVALITLSACDRGSPPDQPEPDPPDVTEDVMSSDEPTTLQAAIASARADLAGRLEIDEADIEASEAREVTWRDGALGCPEPDMMYTQALVSGYYIKLRVGDDAYAYHSGRDGQPFLCPAERSQPPVDDQKPLL